MRPTEGHEDEVSVHQNVTVTDAKKPSTNTNTVATIYRNMKERLMKMKNSSDSRAVTALIKLLSYVRDNDVH